MGAVSCIFNCLQLAKYVPVIFILCVLSWSYYAYVIQLCICKFFDFIKLKLVRNTLKLIKFSSKHRRNK